MLDLFNVLNACKEAIGADVPPAILNIIHYLYLGIQIIVPIMLIIFGMLDLARALSSQKEDEIKKAQSGLIKKAITAVLVFLIFALVGFIVKFASNLSGEDDPNSQNQANVWNCVSCFIGGSNSDACSTK